MNTLREKIFNEVDYIALDTEQKNSLIKTLLDEMSISSIIDEILETLKSNVEIEIYIVSLFLRDVCVKSRNLEMNKIVGPFRAAIEKSNIFEVMNQNLYSEDRLIRETTYRTFGLTCLSQNAHYLKKAFAHYKEHFPDQLEALESEHKWLVCLAQDEAKGQKSV